MLWTIFRVVATCVVLYVGLKSAVMLLRRSRTHSLRSLLTMWSINLVMWGVSAWAARKYRKACWRVSCGRQRARSHREMS